jgi:hypothetical protein
MQRYRFRMKLQNFFHNFLFLIIFNKLIYVIFSLLESPVISLQSLSYQPNDGKKSNHPLARKKIIAIFASKNI